MQSALISLHKYGIVKRLAAFVRHARSMFRKLAFLALGHLAAHHRAITSTSKHDNGQAAAGDYLEIDCTTVVDMRHVNILKVHLEFYASTKLLFLNVIGFPVLVRFGPNLSSRILDQWHLHHCNL